VKGYRAYVQVYNEIIYVNTFTGEGIDKVIIKIDPLLRKLSSRLYIPGYNFEDLRGEIIILAIDGIRSFDPTRNVKLSTFLQTHLRNKINSWIKSENKLSNDAFYLFQEDNDDSKKTKTKTRTEVNFNQFDGKNNEDSFLFENTISDDGGLYNLPISDYDLLNFKSDLIKSFSKLDLKTKKIVELIYFKDYSIQDAAEEVGLSSQAASIKLKKLANKSSFRSIF
jgi:RNA polymerase sigma factor (sigma-70 family)